MQDIKVDEGFELITPDSLNKSEYNMEFQFNKR